MAARSSFATRSEDDAESRCSRVVFVVTVVVMVGTHECQLQHTVELRILSTMGNDLLKKLHESRSFDSHSSNEVF